MLATCALGGFYFVKLNVKIVRIWTRLCVLEQFWIWI